MRIFFLILIAFFFVEGTLIAAEAGMPQLDPKYWASQAFWLILVFSLLYLSISKFFIPKIKNSLDDRENKIKDDLDEAKNLKENAEKKLIDTHQSIDSVPYNGLNESYMERIYILRRIPNMKLTDHLIVRNLEKLRGMNL